MERAAGLLRAGELVAFPTDTVYGVGALFSNQAALERIYLAKGRPEEKGIPLLLASADALPLVTTALPEAAQRLAAAYWPGPLTSSAAQGAGRSRCSQPDNVGSGARARPPAGADADCCGRSAAGGHIRQPLRRTAHH